MKMLRICFLLLASLTGVWLLGCSSSGSSTAAPTPTPVPAPAAAAAPQPATTANTSALSTQGEYPGIEVAIQELKRTSSTLTLKLVMTNHSNQSFPTYYYFFETGAHSVDGIHLIDPIGKKKYFVVRDADGACVCSREVQAIAPGGQSVLWAKFPVPPDDVQKITIEIPHFPPFEDVAITR